MHNRCICVDIDVHAINSCTIIVIVIMKYLNEYSIQYMYCVSRMIDYDKKVSALTLTFGLHIYNLQSC